MAKDIKFKVSVEGTDKATEDVSKLNKEVEKTSESVSKLGDNSSKTGGLMGAFGGSLGNLKGTFGQLDEATGGFGKTLMGLLANPIVAIIAGITGAFMLLYKALQSSEEGQNKLNKITGMLGVVFQRFMDVLEPLAMFIADYVIVHIELMTAAFSKAAEVISGTMRFFGFGEAADGLDEYMKKTEDAAKIAQQVADQRAEADVLERENIVAKAEADRLSAEATLKMSDTEKYSLEERMQAARDAFEAQDAVAKKQEKAAKIRLDALKTEASLTKNNKDLLKQIADQEAALITIQTDRAGKLEQMNGLIQQMKDEDKAAAEAAAATAKAAYEKRLADAKKAYDDMLNALKTNLDEEFKLYEDNNKKIRLQTLQRFNNGVIDLEEYEATIKEMEQKALTDRLERLQQENVAIAANEKIKLEDRQRLIKENERLIVDLQLKLAGDRQKEVLDAEKKAAEDAKKEEEARQKKDLEELSKKRLELILQFNEGELQTKADLDKKLAEMEMEQMRKRLETLKVGSEEYNTLLGELLMREKDMRDQANNEALAADQEAYNKRLEMINNTMGLITQISDTALGIISEISQRSFDDEMSRIDEKTNTALTSLEKEKNMGLITEETYNKELEKINKKRAAEEDKVKRAKFNQDKAIKTIETIINTAAGIAAAIPNIPLMVIAGVAGAAQLAMIASQQYPGGAASSGGGGGMAAPSVPDIPAPAPFVEAAMPEFTGMEGAGPGGALIGSTGRAGETTTIEVVLVESEFTNVQNRVRTIEDRSMIL